MTTSANRRQKKTIALVMVMTMMSMKVALLATMRDDADDSDEASDRVMTVATPIAAAGTATLLLVILWPLVMVLVPDQY